MGHKDKNWYAEERKPYDLLQSLLTPHQEEWIEADCIAALAPDSEGQKFSIQINGVTILEDMHESQGLRRRMLLQKMPILIATCSARIFGGGVMPQGDKRGYGIALDLKPFSR